MSQRSLKHSLYTIYSELGKTLFPVECTSNIKVKVTHRRIIGDGCIWEEISLVNGCCAESVSQSVFFHVLNAVADSLFWKKLSLIIREMVYQNDYVSDALKRNDSKVFFPEVKINWHVLQTAQEQVLVLCF